MIRANERITNYSKNTIQLIKYDTLERVIVHNARILQTGARK